jgi:hypothetical protein
VQQRNNCHIGGHFENKMAAIALKFVAQIYVFYDYSADEFYEKMAAILNKLAAISCVDKQNITFNRACTTL